MKSPTQSDYEIAVIGAGIVGIASALTLQRAGYRVCLVDKDEPGQQTSFGNAGLLATSPVVPINNPGLWRQLPAILLKQSHYVSYDWQYLLSNVTSFARYLSHATAISTQKRAKALKQLIYPSIEIHQQWMKQAGILNQLRDTGWLKLYTSTDLFNSTAFERKLLTQHQVDIEVLDTAQILELEPNLPATFRHGLLVRDSQSIDNPEAVSQAYTQLFINDGGSFIKTIVQSMNHPDSSHQWLIHTAGGQQITADKIVLSLGPWSKDFFFNMGIKLPMIYERGGHRMFNTKPEQLITRPVYDAEGGFIITPMQGLYRMTCGVQLTDRKKPYQWDQLNKAEQMARTRFPLDSAIDGKDWDGIRPCLPDYLPVIGETRHKGLWVNTGHQHQGLTMAPESARILTQLIQSAQDGSDTAYSAIRFN